MTEPKETTMATIQGTRDNPIEGRLASTPKPKDKKAPRSILKGKNNNKNEDKKEKIEGKHEQNNDIAALHQIADEARKRTMKKLETT
jgi:hypothetical protein